MRPHSLSKIFPLLAVALLLSAASAVAQTTPDPAPEPPAVAPETPPSAPRVQPAIQDTLSFDEFRKLSDGKTLHFHLPDGTPWGREYYIPGTQDSVFVFHDGECFEGYWTYDGQHYCYHYQTEPSCWVHFWRQGQLTVESRGGHRQVVVAIRDREPLSCKPDLLSGLPSPNG